MTRQRVMPPWHRDELVAIAFAHEFAIAVGGHPARAGEVGVMDASGTLRVGFRIKAEQDMDSFAPIGAVRGRVEQTQIELHMLTIIGREPRALWRLVKKICAGHNRPLESFLSIPEHFVNRMTVAPPQCSRR